MFLRFTHVGVDVIGLGDLYRFPIRLPLVDTFTNSSGILAIILSINLAILEIFRPDNIGRRLKIIHLGFQIKREIFYMILVWLVTWPSYSQKCI